MGALPPTGVERSCRIPDPGTLSPEATGRHPLAYKLHRPDEPLSWHSTQTNGLPGRLAEAAHMAIKSRISAYKVSLVLESQKMRHFLVRFFVRFLSLSAKTVRYRDNRADCIRQSLGSRHFMILYNCHSPKVTHLNCGTEWVCK